MKRLSTFVAASVLATIVVGMFAGSLFAQTSPRVYAACAPGERAVRAADLPTVIRPGRCPLAGRQIEDSGIGTVVPPAGFAIHAERYGPEGSQELTVAHRADGTIELDGVGSEPAPGGQQARGAYQLRSSRSRACSDSAHSDRSYALRHFLRYYFNARSTPGELRARGASRAILGAGNNLARASNDCGFRDRVPAHMIYEGTTRHGANINTNGGCTASDNRSVVGFGTLPRSATATSCDVSAIQPGYDRPTESDIRINKAVYAWTTHPLRRSCRHRYDVESTVTHERGHTFGLGHVSESAHGVLTMSPTSEGPCQASERTLGRGDVIGLNNKYR